MRPNEDPTRGREPDEIDETLSDRDPASSQENAAAQDFALRNVAMSNTLGQSGAAVAPAAGAVIGSGGDLPLEPHVDRREEEAATGSATDEARPGDRHA